ncbi:mechanosensitive ion channel family protein [Robiginitomaculum antarcticum]|uniref:mechanosensitive ion channel family protein n=1 Tax=Robiginitomaculum antarcticum TaxID=437507 RepID=UPI00039D488B|nr:mechanosensitive ion channel family protein [Robiginitomaculum antarcticum]
MRYFLAVWFLVFSSLVGMEASAQTPPDDSSPAPVIETFVDSAAVDERIQSRLQNIFAELDDLGAVTVTVNEGVVTLGGETANEAGAQKAQSLAERMDSVVAVQDNITRTLAVRDNVAPVVTQIRGFIKGAIKALPLIAISLIIATIFALFGGFLARRKTIWAKIAPNPFLAELMAQAVRIIFVVIGVIFALKLLGAGAVITTLLGGAGVVGLAIGFAVRDSMENYISSIMLSLRQPFRAKDHVVINEHEGIVVRLTSRATILMTLEGNHLRIPNSNVFKGIILNYTTNSERRFEFELGVDAADDPVAAMKAGLDSIRALPFVLNDPEAYAVIETVGDSNIVIKFMAWIDQKETNFGKARSLAIRDAKDTIEEQGFTLPEPIYRLRLDAGTLSALEGRLTQLPEPDKSKTPKPAPPKPQKPAAVTVEPHDDVMDVSPNTHLEDRIEAEIQNEADSDLLDKDRPRE